MDPKALARYPRNSPSGSASHTPRATARATIRRVRLQAALVLLGVLPWAVYTLFDWARGFPERFPAHRVGSGKRKPPAAQTPLPAYAGPLRRGGGKKRNPPSGRGLSSCEQGLVEATTGIEPV